MMDQFGLGWESISQLMAALEFGKEPLQDFVSLRHNVSIMSPPEA